MRTLFLMSWLALSVYGQTKDISGTWIAKRESPMGEMEMVCELKVINGKISGTQKLPFGDAPIIDGKVEGDTFEFTVETESFGTISKRMVIGKIVGDTLQFAPTMPQRPPGGGPGGVPGGGGPPPGLVSGVGANRPPGARPQGGGPGGPGGPGGLFSNRCSGKVCELLAYSVNHEELQIKTQSV